jgi:hypothetical protein
VEKRIGNPGFKSPCPWVFQASSSRTGEFQARQDAIIVPGN